MKNLKLSKKKIISRDRDVPKILRTDGIKKVITKFENQSIHDTNKIRSAVGLGVDWFTPIGPLNFSFAQEISKHPNDKTETFRFNLGTTF